MKKSFIAGTLFSVISFIGVGGLLADMNTPPPSNQPQVAAPDDKAGGTPTTAYGSATSSTTQKPLDNDVTTVPSGKRHRTHRKMHQTETTDDSKTIQSGDVTPVK